MIESHPWRGDGDLHAMQELALEQWRRLGPRAPWHVGDLAWALRQHEGREQEWRIRLWEQDRRVVAWSWLRIPKGELDVDVLAEHSGLLEEILAEPEARTAYAFEDDDERRAVLVGHGFERRGEILQYFAREVSDAPLPPPLPDGYRYRTVEPDDLAERVAVHRDVWAPSRVTESSFASVRTAWPYRGSLDCVVEAPNGRFAGYCLVWLDHENAVGELEPVGVREEFRRRGFGRAVCTFALRRLYEEGGRRAIVYCIDEPACALYRSLGFRNHARLVAYSR